MSSQATREHGADETGVRKADFDVGQTEALENGFAEEYELDVAGRARVADEFDAALRIEEAINAAELRAEELLAQCGAPPPPPSVSRKGRRK